MLLNNIIFIDRGAYGPDSRVKVMIQETTTEIEEPVYEEYSSQPSTLSRMADKRFHKTNGHTASNATRELDDLMASLSEFKVTNIIISVLFNAIESSQELFIKRINK